MKNYIKLSFFAFLLAGFAACEPDQGDEGYMSDRTPSAFFTGTSGILFIEDGMENVYDVSFGLSTPQNEALTYQIEVDPSSSAVEGVDFTTDLGSGVIPAGMLITSFKVTGNFDTALSAPDAKVAVFNLVAVENAEVKYRTKFALTLSKSCPLAAPFTGMYTITQSTPGYPVAGGAPLFANNLLVEVTAVTGEPFTRKFSAKFYPGLGFANPVVPIHFELVCGMVNMIGNKASSGIGCGGSIEIGPTTDAPSSYDPADDSVIEITLHENSNGQCGDPGQQTTIVLTKQGA